MNYIKPEAAFCLLRFIVFIWAASELASLCFLYSVASKGMGNNRIMRSMRNLFGSLAFFFFYLAILPIVYLCKAYTLYEFLVMSIALVVLPSIYFLDKFRYWSITIPDDHKKIK